MQLHKTSQERRSDLAVAEAAHALATLVHAHPTCALSLSPMHHPVRAADGHLYERSEIESWVATHSRHGKWMSPRTLIWWTNTVLTPTSIGAYNSRVPDRGPRWASTAVTAAPTDPSWLQAWRQHDFTPPPWMLAWCQRSPEAPFILPHRIALMCKTGVLNMQGLILGRTPAEIDGIKFLRMIIQEDHSHVEPVGFSDVVHDAHRKATLAEMI